LANDQLIAMAHLAPVGKTNIKPNHRRAGRLHWANRQSRALDDGKYNVLLLGVRRAHIVRELPLTRSFRQAEVTILDDFYGSSGAKSRAAIRRRLLASFQSFIPKTLKFRGRSNNCWSGNLVRVLTDMVAHTMNLTTSFKLQLLANRRLIVGPLCSWNILKNTSPPIPKNRRKLNRRNPNRLSPKWRKPRKRTILHPRSTQVQFELNTSLRLARKQLSAFAPRKQFLSQSERRQRDSYFCADPHPLVPVKTPQWTSSERRRSPIIGGAKPMAYSAAL